LRIAECGLPFESLRALSKVEGRIERRKANGTRGGGDRAPSRLAASRRRARAFGGRRANLAFDKETAEATRPLDHARAALSKVEGRNALSRRGLTAAAKRLAGMTKFTRLWRVRGPNDKSNPKFTRLWRVRMTNGGVLRRQVSPRPKRRGLALVIVVCRLPFPNLRLSLRALRSLR